MVLPSFMVGQNLITNGDFENTGTPPPSWSKTGATFSTSATNPYKGAARGNLGNEAITIFQNITPVQDVLYQVSFYWRFNLATSTTPAYASVRNNTDNAAIANATLTAGRGEWTYTTFTFTATATTGTDFKFQITKDARNSVSPTSTNNAVWLDNVSIRRVDTFNGTDGVFETSTNWDSGATPTDSDIVIPAGKNITIASAVTAGNISVDGTSSLTVSSGNSLNVFNNIILDGGASLVATGATLTGDVTYKRTLTAGKWHLVSPPVTGATYNDTWISENDIASGGIDANNRGISTYQNGAADPDTGQWVYVQAGDAGTFDSSKGYGFIRPTTGTISFTGGFPTGQKPATVSAANANKFNLIGNPYPTYLLVSTFFTPDANANFNNTVANGRLTEETIWIWDQSTNSYLAKTSSNHGTDEIAPGQAFFVSAASDTNITFYQASGTHKTGSDTFLKTSNKRVELRIDSGDKVSKTELFYRAEGTNDFDNGYDASMFTGVASNFSLYTSQLSNEAKKLAIQTLSDENVESLVIPVGIKAAAGQEITFSAEAMNLPEGIKVFLEDRQSNTITRLDEANATYKITLEDAVDGNGRFFLHTKTSAVLSTDGIALQNVSIYKISNETLRVVGLTKGTANIKVFNVLGKQVLNTTFQSKGANDIALPKLATGMYIVQLQSENGKMNKKIILE